MKYIESLIMMNYKNLLSKSRKVFKNNSDINNRHNKLSYVNYLSDTHAYYPDEINETIKS